MLIALSGFLGVEGQPLLPDSPSLDTCAPITSDLSVLIRENQEKVPITAKSKYQFSALSLKPIVQLHKNMTESKARM